MLDESNSLVHTAEALRQVEGAGLEKSCRVGGDAWLGSVSSCIELKKRMDVSSSFVTKNNTNFFPMLPFHR